MSRKNKKLFLIGGCIAIFIVILCIVIGQSGSLSEIVNLPQIEENVNNTDNSGAISDIKEPKKTESSVDNEVSLPESKSADFSSIVQIPKYSGNAYSVINNNVPYFNDSELTTVSFENYSSLDSLGRCGAAIACVGKDIMPVTERGNVGQIKPTGWRTVKYENVDGKYLYNRCHLIGYQLTGENANEKNLITGTRYLNTEGMLPFENMVADYIKETDNHVLYRVTPVFEGNNLLASGVLMEGYSVEDKGAGICYNVFCYNVQPGINIDYTTGESVFLSDIEENTNLSAKVNDNSNSSEDVNNGNADIKSNYIANKNSQVFHVSTCSSAAAIKENNKEYLNCTRDEAVSSGYRPCKRCNP